MKKMVRIFLLLCVGSLVSAGVSFGAQVETWVVEFKSAPTTAGLNALRSHGLKVERLSPYRSGYFDRVYRVEGVAGAELSLKADSRIKKVESSVPMEMFSNEDPLRSEQWALSNNGHTVREEITDLKSNFRKGVPGEDLGWSAAQPQLDRLMKRDAVVAVLDSGVDLEHEDLKSQILLNEKECESGRIPLGAAKEDHDGNGYPGDCMGINLTTQNPTQKNRPYDDELGHGTHVASLMAATSGNGLGISGISNRIRILPVKVLAANDRSVRIALSDRVAEGILYAVSRGADVINLSVGWPRGQDAEHVHEAVKEAAKKGVLIVAAAGNNSHSTPVYPCAYADVICVGATRNDGKAASFSNYGAHVDILAPGDSVLGAYPEKEVPKFFHVNGYEIKSGTSQAAPYVAGAAAILKAMNPNASREVLTGQLLQSTRPVAASGDVYFNGGVLSLKKLSTAPTAHYVRWIYKETSVVAVNSRGGFSLPITMQNLSGSHQNVSVKITSAIAGAKFSQNVKSFSLAPWQTLTLPFAGVAQSQDLEGVLRFSVSYSGRSVTGEVLLARDLSDVGGGQTLAVEQSVGVNQLMTVTALDNEVKGLYLFTLARSADEKGLDFHLWKRQADKVSKIGVTELQDIAVPVGFFEMDANLDGRRDIVILALRKVTIEVRGKEEQQYRFSIFYFNENLSPLIPGQARVDLEGKNLFNYSSFNNHRKTRWFSQKVEGLGTLKVPSIVETGLVPEEDMRVQDRRTERNDNGEHVYYLQPYRNNVGAVEFRTRILDGAAFQNEVRQALDLRYYEALAPQWSPLTAAESDVAKYIFRAGVLEKSAILEVQVSAQGVQWKKLNWSSPYLKYVPMLAKNELRPLEPRDVLFGLVAPNRAHLVVLDQAGQKVEQSLVLDLPEEWEDIVQPLFVSIRGNQVMVAIESGLSLYGFVFQAGRLQKVHQRRVVRSTFHGNAISQIFLPVLLPQGETALYVDSTQLYANNIFLWKLDPVKGFTNPLRSGFTLPKNCRALNPVQWEVGTPHRMTILCGDASGYKIRYLAN